jgi:hypothetical protein
MKQHFLKYGGYVLAMFLLCAFLFPDAFLPAGVVGAFALPIFTQTCGKNVSGASRIFIADKAVATGFTITSGEISAIIGTTPFMRIDALQDSVSWEEKGERIGLNNWKVSNLVKFRVMPPSKETSTFLQALIDGNPCGYFAIVLDGNGRAWLVGHNATDVRERPLKVKTQTQSTGEGLSDANGNTIPIEMDNECAGKALPLDATLTASLLAGTANFCKWS